MAFRTTAKFSFGVLTWWANLQGWLSMPRESCLPSEVPWWIGREGSLVQLQIKVKPHQFHHMPTDERTRIRKKIQKRTPLGCHLSTLAWLSKGKATREFWGTSSSFQTISGFHNTPKHRPKNKNCIVQRKSFMGDYTTVVSSSKGLSINDLTFLAKGGAEKLPQ